MVRGSGEKWCLRCSTGPLLALLLRRAAAWCGSWAQRGTSARPPVALFSSLLSSAPVRRWSSGCSCWAEAVLLVVESPVVVVIQSSELQRGGLSPPPRKECIISTDCRVHALCLQLTDTQSLVLTAAARIPCELRTLVLGHNALCTCRNIDRQGLAPGGSLTYRDYSTQTLPVPVPSRFHMLVAWLFARRCNPAEGRFEHFIEFFC